LTALVSTTQPWPELEAVLDALVADVADVRDAVEVLVMDGTPDGNAVPEGRYPEVRVERLGRADVFRLRAAGVRRSTGAAIAIVEDHAPPWTGWAKSTLAAHDTHPEAALIVGSMTNGTRDTVLDRAAYAMTLGPFDHPVLPIIRERMPVPANVSYKRWHLPAEPEPGWLEYSAPMAAFEQGSIALAPDSVCEHVQHFDGIKAITIQFGSGRAYGGSLKGISRGDKLQHLATRGRFARTAYRTSKRGLGPRPTTADRAALGVMVAANVAGQLVGLVAGSGRAREALR
jgi:hypothetical protein